VAASGELTPGGVMVVKEIAGAGATHIFLLLSQAQQNWRNSCSSETEYVPSRSFCITAASAPENFRLRRVLPNTSLTLLA